MSAQDDARDALYSAIAKRAEATLPLGEAGQDVDLDKLAGAYAKVAYGPQGGDLERRDSDDYHYTTHEGADRARPAGFTS